MMAKNKIEKQYEKNLNDELFEKLKIYSRANKVELIIAHRGYGDWLLMHPKERWKLEFKEGFPQIADDLIKAEEKRQKN